MVPVHRDQARRASEGREVNKSCIVADNRLEIVCAVGHHPIQLARQDRRVSGNDRLALQNQNRLSKPGDQKG